MGKTTTSSALARIQKAERHAKRASRSYFNSIETVTRHLQKDKGHVVFSDYHIPCRVITPEGVKEGFINAIRVKEGNDRISPRTEVFRSDKQEVPSERLLKDETRWYDIHSNIYSDTSLITDEELILFALERLLQKEAEAR